MSVALILLALPAMPWSARAYPGAPSTWGSWTEDVYLGFSPRQISATADPDGRLRAAFINGRALPASPTRRQALMLSYRRGSASFREQEIVTLKNGLPPGTAYSEATEADFATDQASLKPFRTKIRTSDRAGKGFAVQTRLIMDYDQVGNGFLFTYRGHFIASADPFAYFPRLPWVGNASGPDTVYASSGVAKTVADSLSVSAAGSLVAAAFADVGNGFFPSINPVYRIGGSTLAAPIMNQLSDASVVNGRIFALDSDLGGDGRDAYHLLSWAVKTPTMGIRSELALVRQSLTSPTVAGPVTVASITKVSSPGTEPNSTIHHPQVLLTHATGEPKWIVWSDAHNTEIRVAKRIPPLPVAGDTQQDRRIDIGYTVLPVIDSFAFGSDAALDRLDRLHLVWWTPVSGLIHYARENASGGFDEITLPNPGSGAPALAIGPGDFPYIVYAGVVTTNPGESAPLIITTPPGLQAAYRGDFEDRDRDGRCGLIERAQGSSDGLAENGSALNPLTLSTEPVTVSPGVRRFQTGFQLNLNSVRTPSTTSWTLADGNDTIRIQPTYSLNGMASFSPVGFNFVEEFTIAGRGRYVTVQDT